MPMRKDWHARCDMFCMTGREPKKFQVKSYIRHMTSLQDDETMAR